MVKVHAIDFVTEKIFYEWSPIDFLKLAAFASNLAGIHNLEQVRLRQAEDACTRDMNESDKQEAPFMLKIRAFGECHSTQSYILTLVWCATFGAPDFQACAIEHNDTFGAC